MPVMPSCPTTLSYPWLHDMLVRRFGSEAALEQMLPQPLSSEALRHQGDDRYLSAMTQRVFQAGLRHSVVDARWSAFEAAFGGFDVQAMARIGPQQIEAHMQDARLIRDRAKLQTIPKNARFILDVRQERGGTFAGWIADWPASDIVGLWQELASRAARLGGRSGAGFLRLAGKDTFLLTSDVVARLVEAGVVRRAPKTQAELQAVQHAFNTLQHSSGRPLCQLSAMLAYSIHPEPA